ncbi:MAG TPA: hypothetical protein VFH40_13365, partial [Gemmatimonadales bacterium]|nr:hypothetical protein [Gemmatimonadales bacterium]
NWLYLAEGRAPDQFRWGLIYTPAMVLAVFTGGRGGAYGVALAVAAGNWLLAGPAVWFCLRRSPVRASDLLQVVARPTAASAVAALAVLTFRPWLTRGHLEPIALALGAVGFAMVYVVSWTVLPGGIGEATRVGRMIRAAAAHESRPSQTKP